MKKDTKPGGAGSTSQFSGSFPRYEVKSIMDFLEIPEDRLDDCLVEFRSFLETLRELTTVAKLGAEMMGQDPIEALKLMAFTWVDDGKTDVTVNIETNAGGQRPAIAGTLDRPCSAPDSPSKKS